MGSTIKQGAINTWESVKAGASAAVEKFQSGSSTPKKPADEAAH